MNVTLRKNITDESMIEIITVANGREWMWGTVHIDFIYGQDLQHQFEADGVLEVEMKGLFT